MMVKLGLVRWEDARPFMLQFDALDADGSGMLTKDDMLPITLTLTLTLISPSPSPPPRYAHQGRYADYARSDA